MSRGAIPSEMGYYCSFFIFFPIIPLGDKQGGGEGGGVKGWAGGRFNTPFLVV